MHNVRTEIAKNLLFYRKQNKFTQKQLAELLGVKNSAVSNWEKGLNSIDIDTLHIACTVFNISINDMFGVFSNYNSNHSSNTGINLVTMNKESKVENEYKEVISLYNELDDGDKGEIRGEIKGMLKSEKYYKNKEEYKNA